MSDDISRCRNVLQSGRTLNIVYTSVSTFNQTEESSAHTHFRVKRDTEKSLQLFPGKVIYPLFPPFFTAFRLPAPCPLPVKKSLEFLLKNHQNQTKPGKIRINTVNSGTTLPFLNTSEY